MTTSTPPTLTPRQQEVLDFIRDRTKSYGPTIREIMAEFGFTSPNGAVCHLVALERKGLIRRHANQVRGIEVTE
jgi:repressor LexA